MSRRILTWTAVAVVFLASFLVGRAAWTFADELRDELLAVPQLSPGDAVEVVEVRQDTVQLALSDGALLSGTWGLATGLSYGLVSTVVDSNEATITRAYRAAEGALVPGQAVMDQLAYRGDPARALGILYEGVSIEGELGPMPAWLIEGDRATWIVYVHGAGGRADALRAVEATRSLGYPMLVITYRNDPGAPPSTDGLVGWGFDEWRDVEAAVEFALADGAEDVVLMGSGLGGSAVLMTLAETRLIRSIRGAILDSPILDLATVEESRRPDAGLLGSLGRALASWRFGVEFTRLDHSSRAEELTRPVLLLHGARDALTPTSTAEAFAASGGELVEYHLFAEAGHGQSWNVDPRRYAQLIEGFLTKHLRVQE